MCKMEVCDYEESTFFGGKKNNLYAALCNVQQLYLPAAYQWANKVMDSSSARK